MSAVNELDVVDEEERMVWAWRRDCLAELGVERSRAGELALSDLDVHRLARLVKRGCSLELALEILA